ncbi:hypothetical protein J1N35_043593 [Gossypium stocksii]|uniref:CCHC-type domain-containing protein n=1 Tax=Gossypium stocksii TaxID=47602 RepID=A0A9D3U7S9_9ROSI|nr:hypothetical protein J1N35_043593 [Gossypium stocksii]
MGLGLYSNEKTAVAIGPEEDEDFELSEDDVEHSTINGIPSIKFSDRINQIVIKHMEFTVVIKLLGRTIGYNALQNKVNSIWKPSQPFKLMDVENGYFLAKFKNPDHYERALCQGPWVVFGQYLTVQQWTLDFNPTQPYPSTVMAWIRLLGLPGHMYERQVLREIGATIGEVAKLDFNTDNGVRGRFARMAVFVNLGKPLISQVIINGVTQRIEYEHLPTVCFQCGHYGHIKEICPKENRQSRTKGPQELQVNSTESSPMEATSSASSIGKSISTCRNDDNKGSDSLSRAEILKKSSQEPPIIPNPPIIIDSLDHYTNPNSLNPGKDIGEAIEDCHAQSSLQTVQEIVRTPTTGILDAAKHSVVLFEENSQSTTKGNAQKNRAKTGAHQAELTASRGITKAGNTRKGRSLKVNKEKGNPFKVSPSKISLSDSITSMVELLQTQVQQGLVNEIPKGTMGKTGDNTETKQ